MKLLLIEKKKKSKFDQNFSVFLIESEDSKNPFFV